jgi:hypothetical protein
MERCRIFGSIVASLLVIPAAGEEPKFSIPQSLCACLNPAANLQALKQDRDNDRKLSERFSDESRTLKKKYGSHPDKNAIDQSVADEREFAAGVANDLTNPGGSGGPDRSRYAPRCTWSDPSLSKANECQPDDDSVDSLQRTLDSSACAGMAEAVLAHERFHWANCNRVGCDHYVTGRSGAEIANEEAAAYALQAKLLDREITQVENAQQHGSGNPLSAYWYPGAAKGALGDCARIGTDQPIDRPKKLHRE